MNNQNIPIYIALGANLSNPKRTFSEALSRLGQNGVNVAKVSDLWQSPSWPPGHGHPDYLNAVAEVSFAGTPQELLAILHEIENNLGRERSVKNAPRPLDLDILDFKGRVVDEVGLTLPHPRMLERGFVLFPLEEVTPHWVDPKSGQPLGDFIARLPLKDVAPMEKVGPLK